MQIATGAVGGDLPARSCGISDPGIMMDFLNRAARGAADDAFLVSVEAGDKVGWAMLYGCPWGWSLSLQDDFGPGVGDVFTTRGPGVGDEVWDFGRLFGQELEWSRRYFAEPRLVRPALQAYLSVRKLRRGLDWEPVPGAGLVIDDPLPRRSYETWPGAASHPGRSLWDHRVGRGDFAASGAAAVSAVVGITLKPIGRP